MYEGQVTFLDEEVDRTNTQIGDPIQITDGFETPVFLGIVQQVTQEPATGRTVVVFGPTEHLSPSDFIESLRLARTLPSQSFSIEAREDGEGEGEIESIAGTETPKSNNVSVPPAARRKHNFSTDLLSSGKIEVSPGWLYEDGDAAGTEVTPSPSTHTVSGTESLYVIADTDIDGAITGITTDWLTTAPTGLQRHRQAGVNSEADPGLVGKYAWRVLTAVNSGGQVTVTPYISTI
jgi:hypothetical protein